MSRLLRTAVQSCVTSLRGRSALDESIFCEYVRVVGTDGLDDLGQRRTLPAVVCQRMAAVVAAHEKRLAKLDVSISHVVVRDNVM